MGSLRGIIKLMSVLKVNSLTKKFGKFTAVDNISFELNEGEILGLLGPNGAGKTTTIQMLLGTITPTFGTINYFEKDFTKYQQECLQLINFTSTFNSLQGRITVWENLLVFAYLYQVKNPAQKIKELTKYFEVYELLNIKFRDLSSGQQTRINIVKSLLNDPKILLMDEPTASLDPDIADKLLTFIEKLKSKQNIAILYTSHNMHEVTRICDRVIFLDKGHIVAEDTPEALIKKLDKQNLEHVFLEIVRGK